MACSLQCFMVTYALFMALLCNLDSKRCLGKANKQKFPQPALSRLKKISAIETNYKIHCVFTKYVLKQSSGITATHIYSYFCRLSQYLSKDSWTGIMPVILGAMVLIHNLLQVFGIIWFSTWPVCYWGLLHERIVLYTKTVSHWQCFAKLT